MLTSITPLGERGRGQRWSTTSVWLLIGHIIGGAALGVVMSLLGGAVRASGLGLTDTATLRLVGAGVLLAAVFDAAGGRIPGRRQVDERWLTAYRGWVYGLGFGLQLGFGLVTVINTALVGAVVVAGALLSVPEALTVGVVYGLVRGMGAGASGWVRSIGDLHRLHRAVDRSERRIRWFMAAAAAIGAVGAVMA